MHQPIAKLPREVSTERRTSAAIALAALGCFVALAMPALLDRVYVADDLGEFHLPVRDFYARQLQQGEQFDWMSSLYGGYYIAAEGQLGAYHPWHLVLYRWLPLGIAFDLELLASYPFMFAGSYLLLRRFVGRRDAALCGALAFTFGGFNLLHFVHPNAIAVVSHLPWLLLATEVALAADNRWHAMAATGGLGLLTASQLLLGYPQYVWFSWLAEAALIGWRIVGRQAPVPRIAAVSLALVGGVLAGAVQWIPTWHLLAESTRQAADSAFAATGSLHSLNLVQLVAPYLFETRVVGRNTHELGLYLGAVPLVLCCWLLAHRQSWGRYRTLVRALLLFCAVALLLAMGEFGGLYHLQSLVPGANRFRFPCRAIVLVQLGAAALVAVAIAILFGRRIVSYGQPRVSRSLAIPVIAAVVLAILGPILWPEFVARPVLVWIGPVLVTVAAGLIALIERGSRGSAIALAMFMAADLASYGISYAVWHRTADLDAFVAGAPHPPADGGGRVAASNQPDGLRVGNRMLLAGLLRADGYAGLEPARQLDYRDPNTLRRAGVAWVWQSTEQDGRVEQHWTHLEPHPRAQLASAGGGARVAVDSPGDITIDTDSATNTVLKTTESFDSGWVASIDGRPWPVVRVDGDFLGCAVAGGKHRVRFEFRPAAKTRGILVSLCGLGLIVMAGCLPLVRRTAAN